MPSIDGRLETLQSTLKDLPAKLTALHANQNFIRFVIPNVHIETIPDGNNKTKDVVVTDYTIVYWTN